MLKAIIWTVPIDLEALNQQGKNTLLETLGITFTEVGDAYLIASMPVNKHTLQPLGILHGGASCALAETVGSIAGNHCIDPTTQFCVGLEINVNHIRIVHSGIIKAIARPLHLGKSTQVWEIKLYDGHENLISASRLTLLVLEKKEPGS